MPNDQQDMRALRAKPRLKIFQPVELDAGAGPLRAHLLDLSTTGALVHANSAPTLGASVRLLIEGQPPRAARVMWCNGARFGIAFTTPLADAQVEAVLRSQRGAAPRKPDTTS